jgi:hypothetical protein
VDSRSLLTICCIFNDPFCLKGIDIFPIINTPIVDTFTYLMLASANRCPKMVEYLIKQGANISDCCLCLNYLGWKGKSANIDNIGFIEEYGNITNDAKFQKII